jgi:hypothetical protein
MNDTHAVAAMRRCTESDTTVLSGEPTMSACLCTPKHIATLAHAVGQDPHLQYSAREAAELFATENADAVGECGDEFPDEVTKAYGGFAAYLDACHAAAAADVPPLHIITLAQSLDFQNCQYPYWEDSRAKTLLDALIETQISKLPGYDSAPWTL